jgi:hypothetical protein
LRTQRKLAPLSYTDSNTPTPKIPPLSFGFPITFRVRLLSDIGLKITKNNDDIELFSDMSLPCLKKDSKSVLKTGKKYMI